MNVIVKCLRAVGAAVDFAADSLSFVVLLFMVGVLMVCQFLFDAVTGLFVEALEVCCWVWHLLGEGWNRVRGGR